MILGSSDPVRKKNLRDRHQGFCKFSKEKDEAKKKKK